MGRGAQRKRERTDRQTDRGGPGCFRIHTGTRARAQSDLCEEGQFGEDVSSVPERSNDIGRVRRDDGID